MATRDTLVPEICYRVAEEDDAEQAHRPVARYDSHDSVYRIAEPLGGKDCEIQVKYGQLHARIGRSS